MLKKINALIFFMLLSISGTLYAQFPYYESFKKSTADKVIFGPLDPSGNPYAYLTSGKLDAKTNILDPNGEGYLRLTENLFDRKGYVHSVTSFSSQYGLKIEFEYFTYGGPALQQGSADGITFFLYDASVTDADFKIGGFGGSLGYAQYQKSSDPTPTAGVTGGYLGIGLDEYGNFSNPIELRSGGDGFRPSSVTLRGRGTGFTENIPNSSIKNYRYLTHRETRKMDPSFDLSGGSIQGSFKRHESPAETGYRKAIIHLKPAIAPKTGYFITVKIQTGATPVPVTHVLIEDEHYPDIAPSQLKYGIASSTGFQTNYHEIRNLHIGSYDPIPPIAVNDSYTVAKNTPKGFDIIANDTDLNGNGTIDRATILITDFPDFGSQVVNPATGILTYTPVKGYIGPDVLKYRVKDDEGTLSNEATVLITVESAKPVGIPDESKTNINTPVNINVLQNDPTNIDVSAVLSAPATLKGGTVSINPDGTIKYSPPLGFLGSDTFTYRLKDSDGLISDPITVTVEVQSGPIANNDIASTLMDQYVEIDVLANDKDNDGTIVKSSVFVSKANEPKHGKISGPDAQGRLIYTPTVGYVGSDSFKYVITDNDGLESAPATVTITIASVPKIGLAKAFIEPAKNSINGTFIVRFVFTVGNYGIEPLEKVSIKDNLATAFAGAQVKVLGINPTGSLKANPNFNGVTDTELLSPASTLAANTIEKVELILNILITTDGFYQNRAIAEGYSVINGSKTTDASVSGNKPDPEDYPAGDVSAEGPTFVKLVRGPLYIPQGFSPNGDGVNDVFIISNSLGKRIHLDVFNRWGNRVYKSSSYQNDWDGRCTEGIYLGQDLPVGTYYYIVVIEDKDKFMGYITINR
ncbi:MAG: tandem-95 repeat protein [Sphingobacteriaceae bacterium]|nr:tandem-95 repeat protein [Sphingobacteriaceae bacterium]